MIESFFSNNLSEKTETKDSFQLKIKEELCQLSKDQAMSRVNIF